MWNPLPPTKSSMAIFGQFLSGFVSVAGVMILGLTVGILFHSLGVVWMLDIGWIIVVILGVISGLFCSGYKLALHNVEQDAESAFSYVMLSAAFMAFGASLFLLLGELLLFLSQYIGIGLAIAALLTIWVFPPTNEILRGLLSWLVIWFGDMVMVWMVCKTSGICHRVTDSGWGLFWARGELPREVLKHEIKLLKVQISHNINYQNIPLPRRSMSFGWKVPLEAVHFVYDGLANNHVEPQHIEMVNWLHVLDPEENV